MKTTRYDEREVNQWLFRQAIPAVAWAALLAFFAFAGASSPDEPNQMSNVATAPRVTANETQRAPAIVVSAPSARERARRDGAVIAPGAIDPVRADRDTTR